jgi:hypothetical protein
LRHRCRARALGSHFAILTRHALRLALLFLRRAIA